MKPTNTNRVAGVVLASLMLAGLFLAGGCGDDVGAQGSGKLRLVDESPPAPRDSHAPSTETVSLTFGLYQTDKPTVMYKKFKPFLDILQSRLTQRLEKPVAIYFKMYKTYDDALESLVTGEVDFVRFGPSSYVLAKARNAKIRLIAMEQKNGKKRFRGLIIVSANSPIGRLEDLKGKRFAFGDRNSTIGRYLVQAELLKAGIHADDLADYAYLGRHDKVTKAVSIGDFNAGAAKENTFTKANEKGNLRILHAFDNVTKPWVAREGLNPEVFDALQRCVLEISDRKALKTLKVSGFFQANDSDYDFVRRGMKLAEGFEEKKSAGPAQAERSSNTGAADHASVSD